jgi:hypothetical protein
MFYYKRSINYPSIIQYSIYGERHSGTNFLEGILETYFSIPRTWEFGDKHWFGFTDPKHLIRSPRTLFINIVRNPYDWINGFFLNPYHIPKRNTTTLKNFISKEWYSINPQGEEMSWDNNYYAFTNIRYKNIFEMRMYKLYYLRHILPNLVDNYVLIRYEDLLSDANGIIQRISDRFCLQLKNLPLSIVPLLKHQYKTKNNLLEIINSNLDWPIENTAGYYLESEYIRGY